MIFTMQSAAFFGSVLTVTLFGLIAGFFYAFSVDVMRGLDLIKSTEAIHAMQGINTAVRNPVFFITFFLTPVVGVITAGLLLASGRHKSAFLILGAALVYFLGAFLPTATINVPMNEALASITLNSEDEAANTIWLDYSAKWTFWNTARTLAATVSLVLSATALLFMHVATQAD